MGSRPGIATAIVGARTPAQLAENLKAAQINFSDDDLNKMTLASRAGE